MVQSQYALSWDSYKSNLFGGFSTLQQKEEFVDMTLAADGHMVKVHQVLVALASPYIKDLIATAPCQHPVIFLNNVSHRILCLLLEYIYTGEVVVPADCFASFSETAKSLHIKGLENLGSPENLPVNLSVSMPLMESNELCHLTGIKTLTVPSSDRTEQIKLPAAAHNIYFKRDPNSTTAYSSNTPVKVKDDYVDVMDDGGADSDDGFEADDALSSTRPTEQPKDKMTSNLQFTVSIRGSLQVILNRYIYNLHSTTTRTGVRRWRCVDYRNNKCSAFVVTQGSVVLNRANLHNHSFHDKKILAKIEKKAVYSAIDEVEGYKEKEDSKMDTSENMDDNYLILDDLDKDKAKIESDH